MNKPLILNGKEVAERLYARLPNMNGKELAIITIGDDEASKIYVRNKIKACEKVGLVGRQYKFPSLATASEIRETIRRLNWSDNVTGIMIQRPYNNELRSACLEEWIDPRKDVDGLCIDNMFCTLNGEEPCHYPATPEGIITLLDLYGIPLEGKNVVIIGRSDIVGKPLAAMMTAMNATVTLCHSKTSSLKQYTYGADIIVSAVGKPKYLDKSYLKCTTIYENNKPVYTQAPVIIDVGINRDENGKLCGDVDFDDVLPYVSAITPVPNGVGRMTVYSLISNCCRQH